MRTPADVGHDELPGRTTDSARATARAMALAARSRSALLATTPGSSERSAERARRTDRPRSRSVGADGRAAPGGEGAYLVGRLNALVATAYLAVSSVNLVLRVQGAALLEAVVRALAQSRDPDAADDDDERAGAAPSLLDQ